LRKLSPSEIYAAAAAILLLLLAFLNNAWLMLVVSIVGLVAGLIISRLPAAEGQEGVPGPRAMSGDSSSRDLGATTDDSMSREPGVFGSLRRAAVFGLVGFALALVFAVYILIRG